MVSTRIATFVFAATMGLAGFLLFQVQPIMAKYILPWFGGSATTWIVCMLFFQVALLVGYAYAYALTRPLPIRVQVGMQAALIAVVLVLLPITPAETWKPIDAADPTGRIIALLTVSVGAPYALLATTSPLLQRWLTRIDAGVDVSRLFAVSNFGSFLGLISYPFIVERLVSSPVQTRLWSWGFIAYAGLIYACAIIILRHARARGEAGAAPAEAVAAHAAAAGGMAWLWIAYAALGSVLLLATTNQITQWSAVVPFLWIAPLSLYLLTFVIAFGEHRLYRRVPYAIAFLGLAALTFVLARPESSAGLLVQIGLQCAVMFAGCMLCHGEMVRLRPEPGRLPSFYLAIAFGGALGGVAVALVAPLVFSDYWEHPIVIVAIAALALALNRRGDAGARRWERPAIAAAGLVFALGLGAAVYGIIAGAGDVVARQRNFYGVVKVVRTDMDDPDEASLVMQQAGVDQGSQFLAPAKRRVPACSFDLGGGLGRALQEHAKRRDGKAEPLRIGIIGLGAGMIASHGRAGDTIRYYEINPAVAELAKRHFSFVEDSAARVDVALGDGRILLERESQGGASQHFDILVIDAFRGASPPMHLMTEEAFAIYLRHLEPDGILAINFELDTFEMAPLHRGLAARYGLGVGWFETPETDACDDPVSWALYSRDQGFWSRPAVQAALSPWRDRAATTLLWTDQSSNLMSIINW